MNRLMKMMTIMTTREALFSKIRIACLLCIKTITTYWSTNTSKRHLLSKMNH